MTQSKLLAAVAAVAIAASAMIVTVVPADAKAKAVAKKTTPLICAFLPFVCKKEGPNTVLK